MLRMNSDDDEGSSLVAAEEAYLRLEEGYADSMESI
jgi:hypothetical protein